MKDITEDALPRQRRINGSRYKRSVVGPQQLEIHKEESLVSEPASFCAFSETWIKKWTTNTSAKDVLYELVLWCSGYRDWITLRIESGCSIILKQTAMALPLTRMAYQCHVQQKRL